MSSEAVQQFLKDLLAEADKATSAKVTKAMRLFSQVDDTMKMVVLHGMGGRVPIDRATGGISARGMRVLFENMDLIDGLDSVIEDMEYEVEAAAKDERPHRSDGGGP